MEQAPLSLSVYKLLCSRSPSPEVFRSDIDVQGMVTTLTVQIKGIGHHATMARPLSKPCVPFRRAEDGARRMLGPSEKHNASMIVMGAPKSKADHTFS